MKIAWKNKAIKTKGRPGSFNSVCPAIIVLSVLNMLEETLLHLFWDCPLAPKCWNPIIAHKKRGIYFFGEILLASDILGKPALYIQIMGRWNIWIKRNEKIFKNLPAYSLKGGAAISSLLQIDQNNAAQLN